MISFDTPWRTQLHLRLQQFTEEIRRSARSAQSDEGRLIVGNHTFAWLQLFLGVLLLVASGLAGLQAGLLGFSASIVFWGITRTDRFSEYTQRNVIAFGTLLTVLAYSAVIHPAVGITGLALGLVASIIYQHPKQTLLYGLVGLSLLGLQTATSHPGDTAYWIILSGFALVMASSAATWVYQQAQIGLGQDIQFVLANINMLSADLSELNDLASQLGRDNSFRVNEGVQTAQGLKSFIQALKQQTTQSQQAADQSSQLTQDCFDLINELNQSLDLLTRMGKQSHEANRDIQFFAKQAEDNIPEATRHGLMAVAASLEHLNERMQAYMAKIDVLKRGLNALENQAVSLDRSTHHWIEQGHDNQKQGWELLSNIEQLQTGAEDAYATLGSSVKTVLRVNKLIEDLDRRLQHIRI